MSTRDQVRVYRERLGLTQAEVARRCSLSRQSLNAIELGRAEPSVGVALRLASVLGAPVELLFGEEAAGGEVLRATLAPHARGRVAAAGSRVLVAGVGPRWVALPLGGADAPSWTGDGTVAEVAGAAAQVQLDTVASAIPPTLVVAGAASLLGPLVHRLGRAAADLRFAWFPRSNAEALSLVAAGHAHVAALQLPSAQRDAAARRALGREGFRVVGLAQAPLGVAAAPKRGGPKAGRTLPELLASHTALAGPATDSAQGKALQRHLAALGLPKLSTTIETSTYDEAASLVALGAADLALSSAPAARAAGLEFVALEDEELSLVVPLPFFELVGVNRLLLTLESPAFAAEARALGYASDVTGMLLGEEEPAG